MKLDHKGEAFLKMREGLNKKSYLDTKGVPTIGWGTTVYPNGKAVRLNEFCSEEEAQHYLNHDLVEFEETVNAAIDYDPVRNGKGEVVAHSPTQNMYNALVILCYNIGVSGFKASTVVRYVNSKLRYDVKAIGEAFMLWNKITVIKNGVKQKEVSPGLVNRRKKEIELYFS